MNFDAEPWPIQIMPIQDELLSSFLVRSAHVHGLSPTRFCYYHFPNCNVWNRDIDRSPKLSLLMKIRLKANLTLEAVQAMTLSDESNLVVNKIGVYHRTRRRFGLRFCPRCLMHSKVYLKQWRCAWIAFCTLHRCLLRDACATCGATIIPHRAAQIDRCHACGSFLYKQMAESVTAAHLSAFSVQVKLQSSEHKGAIEDFGSVPSTRVALMLMARKRSTRKTTIDAARKTLPLCLQSDLTEPPLDLSRVPSAIKHLNGVAYLLNEWPQSFRCIALAYRLQYEALSEYADDWPESVRAELARLPDQVIRKSHSTQTQSFRNMLRKIHRQKQLNWRVERAKLLLSKVRSLHVS